MSAQEQEAITLSKESLEVLYAVAYDHIQHKRFHDGEALLYTATIFDPTSKRNWKALAFAQQKQKKYEEACASYAVLSTLDPEDPEPYLRAAECFFLSGEILNGWEALQEAELRIGSALHLQRELSLLKEAWMTKQR